MSRWCFAALRQRRVREPLACPTAPRCKRRQTLPRWNHEHGRISSPTNKDGNMKFGASMFFTDYSMTPAALATALEERGFDILWAPEHSHIPLSRKTPFPL